MTVERILPAGVLRELERQDSQEALLVFLSFYSDRLYEPIRVVSDVENFILDGEEYQAFDFDINLMSDNDGPPRAKLTILNVDERIGEAVLASTTPIRMDMQIVAMSEFNLKNTPRTELNNPSPRVYKAQHLRLAEVKGDLLKVTGTIVSWDYTQESWPAIKATQDRYPGLFWS